MSRGVNIPIGADAKGVITEGKKVEGALEKVIDSLDDVGDASKDAAKVSDKALDSIGDSAQDAAKETEQSAERLERSFKESFQKIEKEAKAAGNVVSKEMKDGTDGASEGPEDMKGEAASTAKETAASFGSVEDALGAVQEIAANAFAGLGPAGAAAGIGAAIGIGILTTALQDAADKANALTEEAGAFALEMSKTDDAGKVEMLRDRWDEVATAIADVRSIWEVWQPRAITNIERFAEAADLGGLNIGSLYAAINDPNPANRLKGLRDAFDDVSDALQDAKDAQIGYKDGVATNVSLTKDQIKVLQNQEGVYGDTKKAIQELIRQEEVAAAVTQALARAQGQTVEQYKAAQVAIEDKAKIEQDALADMEAYASALEGMAEPAGLYSEAMDTVKTAAEAAAAAAGKTPEEIAKAGEAATATLDDVLTELAEEVAKKDAFEANLKALAARGFGALAETLRAGGPEANSAMTDLLAKGTDAQVQQYATDTGKLTGENLTQGAATGVAAKQQALQTAVNQTVGGLTVPTLTVPLHIDTYQAQKDYSAWIRTLPAIPVRAHGIGYVMDPN